MKKFFVDLLKFLLLLIFDYAAVFPAYFWYEYGGPMGLAVYPWLWIGAAYLNYKFAPNILSNIFLGVNLVFGGWFACHTDNMLYFKYISDDAETKLVGYAGEQLAIIFTAVLSVISLIAYLIRRYLKKAEETERSI